MNVLFLSQGKEIEDHPGWYDALEKLQKEKFIDSFKNIPYYGYAKKYGWEVFYKEVVRLCKEEKYDLVYFHYFHNKKIPSPETCLKDLKNLAKPPIIINSIGDPFSDNWMMPNYPENTKITSRYADITFSTQMGKAADKIMSWGTNNLVFLLNSMCQIRLNTFKLNKKTITKKFDVVFVGSNNGSKIFNPISKHAWGKRKRQALVKALYSNYSNKFGLYGGGWNYPVSQGLIPYDDSQKAFDSGKIAVGGNPYSHSDYYSSNRLFWEISSGTPTIELAVPRLDKLFRDKDHLYFAKDIDDIITKIDELLKLDYKILQERAIKAAEYIEEKHTQYHRMKFKIDTVKRYMANGNKLDVQFPFFLPEVDLKQEMQYAIRTKE